MKKLLAILSLFFCMTVTLMAQQVVTTWLSDAVVPGEQTRLFIILTDGSIARQDPLPRVKGASLRWVSQGNYIRWPGSPNQSAFLMAIEVTPDEVGTVEIPSLTLQANNGRTYTTLPQTLTVYPYSAIKWNTLNLNGTAVPYGMLWHVDNQKPYVHQPDRCELKIYAPEYILEYTAPAITTSNLATWRFEPTLVELLRGQPRGSVLYKGVNWNVMTEHPVPAARRGGNGVRHCHGTRRPAGGGPSHRQLHPFGSTGGNGHSGSENHSPGTPSGSSLFLHQCRREFPHLLHHGCAGSQRQ